MEIRTDARLKADVLMPLSVKSDGAAAMQALGHLGTIAGLGAALWWLRDTVWWLPLTLLLAYPLAFLFTTLHETAHQTAFRTRAFNHLLGHLAGFVILLPYEYYRAFHWDHHRFTQDPARDPELSFVQPSSLSGLAWYVAGPPVWFGRVRMLLVHGLAGRVTEPWVPEARRGLIVREARSYLACYAVLAAASVATMSLAALWLWLVPLVVGQWLLRPYLLAEHTGCAHTPDMLENTRTTLTNAIKRFFAWNMPYHAEHHAYPAVPFHALPRLHGLLAGRVKHVEPGYPASFKAVLRHVTNRAAAGSAEQR